MKRGLNRPSCTRRSIWGVFLYVVLAMLSCRLSRGWVIHSSHFLLRGSTPFPSSRTTTRLLLQSKSSSRSLSSSQQTSRWRVGDAVCLPKKEGESETVRGVIQEQRGAGWYTVQVNGSDKILKFRGTQLVQVRESSTETSASGTTSAVSEESVGITVKPILRRSIQGPVPPPPTIIDLDAAVQSLNDPLDTVENQIDRDYLRQVAHHMSYTKWVVFTDLHCAPSTLDTTLEVLERVHQLAVERQAGVLFLGDWWHHRGTLRVDCLNSVLNHLNTWTVPMVLIPGNHDQVTLGGHNHGLTPLENSYRVAVHDSTGASERETVAGPLVFSHPTKFANGLFVPHIRDHAIMESVLQSDHAEKAAAIFVHADVTGAYMNDQIVSLGGVPPSMFPAHKSIYSGHFHKPHLVKSGDVAIEYLGSSYEVSLAEAQQPKALVVLDAADDWKCIERIPLNIGRKHFRALSLDEFLTFKPASGEVDSAVDMDRPVVNAGDRVVMSMNKGELDDLRRLTAHGEDSVVDAHIKALRKGGATVEIREVKELPLEAMGVGDAKDASQLEELSLESTWKAYISGELRRQTLSDASAEALLEAGLEMLEELDADNDLRPDQTQSMTDLKLNSVTLEGYGPFRDQVSYPLLDRGLVLLRGSNKDGGSDSNGSGKSSLAMATLWALTGSVDPRPLQDSKVSDVVNDFSNTTRVSVKGTLNGVDFSITRTKTLKKGGLAFLLGGEDLTTQSAKDTQAVIDEKLGVGAQVLARTMFHGQHAINELLEATDSKLKDELSLVVPLSFWQDAVKLSRKKGKKASTKGNELDGMYALRAEDLDKLQPRLRDAEANLATKEATFKETETRLGAELDELRERGSSAPAAGGESLDSIEERLVQATETVTAFESRRRPMVEERDTELASSGETLDEATTSLASSTARFQSVRREYDSSDVKVSSAKERVRRLEEVWAIDLTPGKVEDFAIPRTCPTCRQPLSGSGDDHSHHDIQETMQQEVQSALDLLSQAQTSLAQIKEDLEVVDGSRMEAEMRFNFVREEHGGKVSYWANLINGVDSELANARIVQQSASSEFAAAARQLQQSVKMNALDSSINTDRESLRHAQMAFEDTRASVQSCESLLRNIQSQRDEQTSISTVMTELSDAFGQRGIQTFVMQNGVSMLESLSQAYLDELSDGAQRLEFALDAGDRISRRAYVRGGDGEYRERPLASLSGGQWRRCSLSLTLGFADLVARRGRLRPSLCVLDEPLTHLDRAGRADVGRVLRKLLRRTAELGSHESNGFTVSTILIILQDLAAEELEESFDCIDEVIKRNGSSSVLVDERV